MVPNAISLRTSWGYLTSNWVVLRTLTILKSRVRLEKTKAEDNAKAKKRHRETLHAYESRLSPEALELWQVIQHERAECIRLAEGSKNRELDFKLLRSQSRRLWRQVV
jgi:hypothetical protein